MRLEDVEDLIRSTEEREMLEAFALQFPTARERQAELVRRRADGWPVGMAEVMLAGHGDHEPLGPFELWISDYDLRCDRITFAADMDDADDYRLEVDLSLEDGEAVVDCVRFVPGAGERRLPATRLFKRLRLGALQTQLAGEVRRPWVLMQVGRTWADAVMSPARPGRRGRPDLHYAIWAKRYVEALKVDRAHPVPLMLERELARGRSTTPPRRRSGRRWNVPGSVAC